MQNPLARLRQELSRGESLKKKQKAFSCGRRGPASAVDEEKNMIPYNKNLVQNARDLRKNMTPEEKHLWYDFLKKLPLTVKRQHNIENYIVDFYIASKKIAIEIDGGQHYTPENKAEDERRDTLLATWDINVLRYSNKSIRENFNGVTSDILKALGLNFSDLKAMK